MPVPDPVVQWVARQVQSDATAWPQYGIRDETRREHFQELRAYLTPSTFGLRDFRTLVHSLGYEKNRSSWSWFGANITPKNRSSMLMLISDHYIYRSNKMGIDNWPWSITKNIIDKMPLSLRDLIGRPIRTLKEGAPHTMEYVSGRVTFVVNDRGLVVDVWVESDFGNVSTDVVLESGSTSNGLPPGTSIPPGYHLVTTGVVQQGDLIYNNTYHHFEDAPANRWGQSVTGFYGVVRRD